MADELEEKKPWQVEHEYVHNNGWCVVCGRSAGFACHPEPAPVPRKNFAAAAAAESEDARDTGPLDEDGAD